MMIILFIFLFASLTQNKLYQVVSLSRHGARYHVNATGGGSDTQKLWGQLTAVGMRQHSNLGQYFRKQYIENLNFLSSDYNDTEIQVYSTPVNRTKQSIISQLYGVYPSGTGPHLNWSDKKWHIPPYSNKSDIEERNFALPNGMQPVKIKLNQKIMLSDCPNYMDIAKRNLQRMSDVVEQMKVMYNPFMRRMADLFNFNLTDNCFYEMLRVWDVVNVDKHLGRPMPEGFQNEDYLNLRHLANWYYLITQTGNNTLMINSEKFSRIFLHFDNRVKLPTKYGLKWTFLSSHDTDVIAMYMGLNISSYSCTQELYRKGTTSALQCQQGGNYFASNIIIELHSNNEKSFFVKVRSNGNYVKICNKNAYECDYTLFKLTYKWNVISSSLLEEICGKKIQSHHYIMTE